MLRNGGKHLIMINSNSCFIFNKILLKLKRHGFNICIPKCKDIQDSLSLGGFLRKNINNNVFSREILILDFTNNLKYLYDDNVDLVNNINVNRDLFTLAYDNVIIISQQPEFYQILKYAYDFKTCVNYYFDTTKWFCSILSIPIIDLPSPASINRQIFDLRRNVDISNHDYSRLFDRISMIKKYDSSLFSQTYSEINNIEENSVRYLAIYFFIDRIINASNTPNNFDTKKKDLLGINYKLDYNMDICIYIFIKLARFYYNACEYIIAKNFFENALFAIIDSWENPSKEYVISFIECNIVVCEYMEKGNHNPELLIEKIKQKLSINKRNKPEYISNFENAYELLLRESLFHHSYPQHKDIFREIINIDDIDNTLFSIEEARNISLMWEHFIVSDFNTYINSEYEYNAPIYNVHNTILHMINLFVNGYYQDAKQCYKKADYLARSYGLINISMILRKINNNMVFFNHDTTPPI